MSKSEWRVSRLLVRAVLALFVLSPLSAQAAIYEVDRLTDLDPAGGGEGSGLVGDFRFAIVHALSGDAITIQVTGTIELAAGLPAISQNICIKGPGAHLSTVRGVGSSVFQVDAGASVNLTGFQITGGRGNGGGILNRGSLTVNGAVISGNSAGDPTNGDGTGGGIWNYIGATLVLNGSVVSENSAIGNLSYAASRGGGIANYGNLTLNNSTVSGNVASQGSGGGIACPLPGTTLTLVNSTISGNSSPGTIGGGGIDNRGTFTARNSIVAGNADGDLFGNVASEGFNLFGAVNGSGFAPTDLIDVAPLLGPLQDNGGSTPTMVPLVGSPAVDRIPGTAGIDFPSTDQRGIARPQGSMADCGAVEVESSQPAQLRGRGLGPQSPQSSGATPEAQAQSASPRMPVVLADPVRPAPRAVSVRSSGGVEPCSPQ
jgi:hypothetical protein